MTLKNEESLVTDAAKPSRPSKAARDTFSLPKGISEQMMEDIGSVCVSRKPPRRLEPDSLAAII